MFIAAHLHLPRMRRGDDRMISVKPRDLPTYYENEVKLVDGDFKVNANGRARVLKNKQREVHAWCRGNLIDDIPVTNMREAYYNPYKCETFVDKETGVALYTAKYIHMIGPKVYYSA